MNIQRLIQMTRRPEVYSKGTAVMWTDEHISTQLLEAHLNPELELASRKVSTIAVTIEWILRKAWGKRLQILDLGCGPGLYSEKLAEKGHLVTGMDFSSNSIRYAEESAFAKKLNITYRCQDYLELKEDNKYDLILMIFTDFGVLPPDQRSILLANIYRALKPEGKFIFDVLNENFIPNMTKAKQWELSSKGFWRNGPHLALTEIFYYEDGRVTLQQHVIIGADGEAEIYRFWIHTFSHSELKKLLVEHKYRSIECYDHIIPGCDHYRSEDVTFCIACK